MKTILHKSETRGHADHGWLNTYHSFSFAEYQNPERMGFGLLRVLNDDYVAPGMGFGKHPHANMEIVSIPLSGDLEHQDSLGNKAVIREGDIQVMSAGTGVYHSEYNKNKDKGVQFLQIWIFPKEQGVAPRYDQQSLNSLRKENQFYQILSPNPEDEGVWIHQHAWFSMGEFETGKKEVYRLNKPENGVYLFLLEGALKLNSIEMSKRDGLAISETTDFEIEAMSNCKVLLMEVPMQ